MSGSIRKRRTLCEAAIGLSATLGLVISFGVFAGTGAAASAVAPTNSSPPTVSGTPQEGQQLTGDRGTWAASPTGYTYFWQRCDKNGGSCANISGATALTYTLGSADVGNSLRFKVDAQNADGTTSSSSAPTAVIAAAAKPAPPEATSLPTVTGTAQEGQKLTGEKGAWSGAPTDYNYYWTRCSKSGSSCANISGATAATYTLTSRDAGNTVRFKVEASNSAGRTFASSLPTAVIAAIVKPVPPVATSLPKVTGTAQEGQRLTGTRGAWSGKPTDYNFYWTRCDRNGNNCADISGATAATYTLSSPDIGDTIRFKVEASNSAGRTFASSRPTAVVIAASKPPAPPRVNRAPTIRILSTRFVGARIYLRLRVCDDVRKNLTIIERDSRPGVTPYTRRFTTLAPPAPCAALTRNWLPSPRFRHGRYTVTVWARDKSGKTSLPARKTFTR